MDPTPHDPRQSGARDFVSFDPQFIVHKTILEHTNGVVDLFAFEKGQALVNRTSPYDGVLRVIEGEAEISWLGFDGCYSRGDIVIIPANTHYTIRASKRTKIYLTTLHP